MKRYQLELLVCLVMTCFWLPGASQATEGETSFAVVFEPRTHAVLSSRVDGVVSRVCREMGQGFSKGNVLLRLDPAIFDLRLESTRAKAEASRQQLSVVESLHRDQSASTLDLANAVRDAAIAAGDLKLAQLERGFCTLSAPYNGRVKQVFIQAQEWVQRGTALMEIVDDRVLMAKVLVPSHLFRGVRMDGEVSIEVNETRSWVRGKISHISPALDAASRTFEVFARVDNKNRQLRSGMTGQLQFKGIQ